MYSIDIDVGGTFTDGFFSTADQYQTAKTFTTPYDLTECVMACVAEGARSFDVSLQQFMQSASTMRLSTTLGTNTLLERRGPKVGLLVTAGHEANLYGDGRGSPIGRFVEPEMIVGIEEQMSTDGARRRAPDVDQVLAQVRGLIARGARNIGVGFADSALDPSHEELVRHFILERYPEHYLRSVPVQLAHEVSWSTDDQARINTLLLNCYLHADLARGLYRVEDQARVAGMRRPVLVVHSGGGCARVAKTVAVQTLSSGPAVAVHGAARLSTQLGLRHVITADMGGTSLDLALITNGVTDQSDDPTFQDLRLSIPMTITESIAAGGGSIAKTIGGKIQVGPESAGANPGPACYGRGGRRPTVTDANLVLGYLGQRLGGHLSLDAERAVDAISRHLCPDGVLPVREAAALVRTAVDTQMARAVKDKLKRANVAPEEVTLFAVGGGGPVHGCAIAELAGIPQVYGFPFGPVFSAFGSSTVNVMHRYAVPPSNLAAFSELESARTQIEILRRQALVDLAGEGLSSRPVEFCLRAVHHFGERTDVLRLDLESAAGEQDLGRLLRPPAGGVLTALSLTVEATIDALTEDGFAGLHEAGVAAPTGCRNVTWGSEELETAIYDGPSLGAGASLQGPAIIESPGTSFAVPPGWTGAIDISGNLVLRHSVQHSDSPSTERLARKSSRLGDAG